MFRNFNMDRNKIIKYIREFDPKHVRVKNYSNKNVARISIGGYTNGNLRHAANLQIQFKPNSTVYLAKGNTERNFRGSNKKYGTVIRALATRAAIHGNANKVTHQGSNEEHLVLKEHAKRLGLSYVNAINRLMRRDPNFLKNLPPPISTKIVRKLGFREAANHPYSSVFYKNMNTQALNKILNQWRGHP
jgi:hypothetical protein